jgi:hypothetical protein
VIAALSNARSSKICQQHVLLLVLLLLVVSRAMAGFGLQLSYVERILCLRRGFKAQAQRCVRAGEVVGLATLQPSEDDAHGLELIAVEAARDASHITCIEYAEMIEAPSLRV